MSNYVTKKKDMNFPSEDALKQVVNVIDEATEGLNNNARTISSSAIPEVLTGALGIGAGSAIGFAALYLGGTVGLSAAGITSGLAAAGTIIGGGMVAGIGVLAAPAVALGAAGVGIASHIKNKKLKEAKMICYTKAVQKQNEIIRKLHDEMSADKDRLDYLNSINKTLQIAIDELKHDLGIE